MGKTLSLLLIVMLPRFVAAGQTLPSLQIVNTNGVAALSWSVSSFPIFFLQGTTNLSSPIMWTNLTTAYGAGTANVPMTNSQQFFRLAEITPIFQFAIFYNLNLEIQPGSGMVIGGPVFCNQSIWAASSSLTFSNSVSAVGQTFTNYSSPGDPFMTPGVKLGTGYPKFISPPISGAGILNFPILGTNNDPASIESLLQLPPMLLGSATAYSQTGQVFFANETDLIITNTSSGGINISAFWQDSLQYPAITQVPYNYYTVSNTITHVLLITNTVAGLSPPYITLYSGYSFITNVTLYDYRESKTVNAIYLNVTNLSLWLTNDAPNGGSAFNQQTLTDTGHGINSIYIFNSVPMTSSTLPGVQVVSGAQLPPYGLAIATPQPIYVQGNYNSQTPIGSDAGLNNTTYTYPAALYADAVTVLSANWNDATESANLFMRIPVTTTVNTAIFQGIVPSSGSNYSGGLENSIRLLENWGSIGVSLYYNGSFVVMFPSQYATNFWSGSVYGVPTRHWAFDSNFTNPAKLPPLTPRVVNYVTP